MKIFRRKRDVSNDAAIQKPDRSIRKAKKAGFWGNLRIAPKLLSAFLLIALMSASMGLYAALSLRDLNNSAKKLHINVLMPTENLASISKYFGEQQIKIRQAVISDNEYTNQMYVLDIDSSFTRVNSLMDRIESLITDKDAEALNTFKSDYLAYQQSMAALMEKLEHGDTEPVRTELRTR